MAVSKNGAEAFTATLTGANNGATIPAGTGETACVAAVQTNSTMAPDTAVFSGGAKSFKISAAAGQTCYVRTPAMASSTGGSVDAAFNFGSLASPPSGSEYMLLRGRDSASAGLFYVTWVSTGFLRIRTNSSVNLWTSTSAFTPTAFRRVAMTVRLDVNTPGNTQVRVAAYNVGSDTPITNLDSGWITSAPLTTGTALDHFIVGRGSTDADAVTFNLDDIRWDPAATDNISAGGSSALSSSTAVTPSSGTTPFTVSSTITASGGNGNPITYDWDWGDGTTTSAQSSNTATHQYTTAALQGGATKTWTVTGAANQS